MQVFLPYPEFDKSVACLDPSRLGNQIYRECLTIIRGKWPNHPASKIWAPYKHALAKYCLEGLKELTKRGRPYPHWVAFYTEVLESSPDMGMPKCVGNEAFHASHRAALLFKDFTWYSRFGWLEEPKIQYIWPI